MKRRNYSGVPMRGSRPSYNRSPFGTGEEKLDKKCRVCKCSYSSRHNKKKYCCERCEAIYRKKKKLPDNSLVVRIRSLSEQTIEDTIRLGEEMFPNEKPSVTECLKASLKTDEQDGRLFMQQHKLYSLTYFAASHADKVVGMTGLYSTKHDHEDANWLGFFCVNPEFRKKSIGKQLIEFSIYMARGRGKKFLRLYTSDSPNEADAQKLYAKHGLHVQDFDFAKVGLTGGEHKLIFRELILKG